MWSLEQVVVWTSCCSTRNSLQMGKKCNRGIQCTYGNIDCNCYLSELNLLIVFLPRVLLILFFMYLESHMHETFQFSAYSTNLSASPSKFSILFVH